MKRFFFWDKFVCTMYAVLTAGLFMTSLVHAEIMTYGSINPETSPRTWTNLTDVTIGTFGMGKLVINNGSSLMGGAIIVDNYGFLDISNSGSLTSDTGTVDGINAIIDVDGEGSSWINNAGIVVGYNGIGVLGISNGGYVETNAWTLVGYGPNSNGFVAVSGEGATWKINGSLWLSRSGTSTLSITDGGSVMVAIPDGGYSSDSITHVAWAYNTIGSVIVDGEGSTWNNNMLFVGNSGAGTLNITNGGSVSGYSAYVGRTGGSSGKVVVDGEGSTWISSTGGIEVGSYGTGKLSVTNGGSVTNDGGASIGRGIGSIGMAIVDGQGSKWTNGYGLGVGSDGAGTLAITNGGLVSTGYVVNIKNNSTVTIDVVTGSVLKVETDTNGWTEKIINDGTIYLVASPGNASGTYMPMIYDIMEGEGTIRILGGIWDEFAHTVTFTDSVSAKGTGGASVILDLEVNQRAVITDSDTGRSAGVAFIADDTSTAITFAASTVSNDDLDSLRGLLTEPDEEIFSAWNFSTEGYTVSASNPVYLSLYAYSASELRNLTIWHLEGGVWTEYEISNIAFDGTYASFVANSFSGYAVTGSISIDNNCSSMIQHV